MQAELAALARADLGWVDDLSSIWRDPPGHVGALHADTAERIARALEMGPDGGSPLGQIVIGPQGSGKTHLLGVLRRRVWKAGGWFVALEVAGLRDFWETARQGFVDALNRDLPEGMRQGDAIGKRLAGPSRGSRLAAATRLIGAGAGAAPARRLAAAAEAADRRMAARHRDVIAAFARMFGPDGLRRDLAQAWMLGARLDDSSERRRIGVLAAEPLSAKAAVEGLSWLMSLTGPTLCAIDQLDAVVAYRNAEPEGSGGLMGQLILGLTDLRDVTRRTLTVVSTIEPTWETLRSRAVSSFGARFHDPVLLRPLSQPETACRLVELRLAPAYAAASVAPPYPTWPFHAAAFVGAVGRTPRDLLISCHKHIRACVAAGEVRELKTFETEAPSPSPGPAPPQDGAARRYAALTASLQAQPPGPGRLPDLLPAALLAWKRQLPEDAAGDVEIESDAAGGVLLRISGPSPAQFWFTIIGHAHGNAVINALRAALVRSGIGPDLPARRLIVLRGPDWAASPVAAALAREFEERGGLKLMPDDHDLVRFAAVERLLREQPPDLDAWLRAARPMDAIPFLQRAGLAGRPSPAMPTSKPPVPPPRSTSSVSSRPPSSAAGALPLGVRASDGQTVALPLAMLARHVAVIAGSGSGKTVLLRRIVEEAVLAGVPSILIDSNNDLVRLADPWPAEPPGFDDEDRRKAAQFQARADVVVWTPGRAQGAPLALAPLPDFAAVRLDAEELEQAVAMAGDALEPLLGLRGAGAGVSAGVLRDALRHLARTGPSTLEALSALMRDLPPEASGISQARKLGPKLSDLLLAAQSRNPLLSLSGPPLDPAALLSGRDGRVRVSVVNLSGLGGEEMRQDFVGRLLMALFGHARRHPARSGTVASLLVMDEAHSFAPSGRASPSLTATRALARQARKYGLGLVFATQAPRDVDHTVVDNCATKLIGRLNSPTAIEVATGWMDAAGGAPGDVGRLAAGEFYFSAEGQDRPVRIRAPMCLSHHPAGPPDEAEIVARAAASRPGDVRSL